MATKVTWNWKESLINCLLTGLVAIPIYYLLKWGIGNHPDKSVIIITILFAMNLVNIKLRG